MQLAHSRGQPCVLWNKMTDPNHSRYSWWKWDFSHQEQLSRAVHSAHRLLPSAGAYNQGKSAKIPLPFSTTDWKLIFVLQSWSFMEIYKIVFVSCLSVAVLDSGKITVFHSTAPMTEEGVGVRAWLRMWAQHWCHHAGIRSANTFHISEVPVSSVSLMHQCSGNGADF